MDRMKLLDLLDDALTAPELMVLARQFAVDFNAFPGATKRDRAREFLGFVQRQGRSAGLAEALVALRPDLATAVAEIFDDNDSQLAWLDQVAGSAGQTMQSGVTWRWPSAGAPAAAGAEDAPPDPASETAAGPDAHPNPYTPGRRLSDTTMFFGRESEAAQIQQQIASGGHVAIVAARTLGASSLLARVAGDAPAEPWLPAYADMKDPALQSRAALLNAIWAQWWAKVKPDRAVPVHTLAEFVTAARKLHAAGFRPLLFLDELEQMVWRPAEFDDNLFDAWLELGREGAMALVTTVHVAPAELFAQSGLRTRFYELFRQLDLGLLDTTAARALLTVPVERAGLALPVGAGERLLALAGPHPFFLQLAGLYLFDALAGGDDALDRVAHRFEAAATPHWQELWDGLSPLAQSHYPATHTKPPAGMAGRQLRILANRGLVVADESGFRPFSEGFAHWLGRVRAAGEAAALAIAAASPAAS